MEQYKQDFIEFMVSCDCLKFGDFTLKSGRRSPFFMNAGAYQTGGQLRALGKFYAQAIMENYGGDFDIIFGPAYKGIPLGVAACMAFNELYGKDISYSSNRKEIKDHGDAGILLGADIQSGHRVVIIEDVTTSGKSMEETVPILKERGDVEILGLMISLNRQEKGGHSEKSALMEIEETYGFPAAAIVTMEEVVSYLYNRNVGGRILIDDTIKASIDEYYALWGEKK